MFLIAFWSPKQFKIKETSIASLAKQLEAHLHEEPKLWSFIIFCQKQIMNTRRESEERNLTWRIQEDRKCWTLLEHFWSSIYAYYMSFRSLGSQKSNALNGAQFRAEMKKLEPLEANHTKLKANFPGYEISLWLRNHKRMAAKWCPSCCKILQPSCTPAKFSWSFPIFATNIF